MIAASDLDAEEEQVVDPGGQSGGTSAKGGSSSHTKTIKSSMASLSGADDMYYTEFKKPNTKVHPLFKRFR